MRGSGRLRPELPAPECLNVSVRTVSRTSTSYQNILATYKASVVTTAQKAELHLQRHYESGVIVPGKEPPGGLYMLVADATPIDARAALLAALWLAAGCSSLKPYEAAGPDNVRVNSALSEVRGAIHVHGVQAGRRTTSVGTLLEPRAGYRYDVGVSYRESIYNVTLRESAPRAGPTRELALRGLPDCKAL